jgi:hypothetical protein
MNATPSSSVSDTERIAPGIYLYGSGHCFPKAADED